tara:strand:- start:6 stop:152 length:147 start_codon:yes stop_codon:yes gene_type:complete
MFTGLQNKDWVPKHDPESQGAGFDIIQPVLQVCTWSTEGRRGMVVERG